MTKKKVAKSNENSQEKKPLKRKRDRLKAERDEQAKNLIVPEGYELVKKNPVGSPPLYKNPEDMQKKIEEFFENPPYKRKTILNGVEVEYPMITISGLVLYLGFCNRVSFYNYEFDRPEFSSTIKRARTLIEMHYENNLSGNNATGSIFALKNFGWIDKTEVDNNINLQEMPKIKSCAKEIEVEFDN